jgi:starch phosphorylase
VVAVAYYSMEVALDDRIPTFSGGLGVLAGDLLRAAADAGLPMVGVTLLYRQGFFRQRLAAGRQVEEAVSWDPRTCLEVLPERVTVPVEGRRVVVRPWRHLLRGVEGHGVPVYFLDTDLAENDDADRSLSDRLYQGDTAHRLRQEAVLGLAGPLMLAALGHRDIDVHHMNEGHAALAPVMLLADEVAERGDPSADGDVAGLLNMATGDDVERVRRRCVFTTHTPVPAGHDRFQRELATRVLGTGLLASLERLGCLDDGTLNMTVLGMRFSHFVNAVSLRHQEVSRSMFPATSIEAITNGVHTSFWAAPATASLFDDHLPGWRADSSRLRYANAIPSASLQVAHAANKDALLREVERHTGVSLDRHALTIGIARRWTAYKRNDLLLSDPQALATVAESVGPVQVLYSGKAHPLDQPGKDMIEKVLQHAGKMGAKVTVVYLPDYAMELARLLCSGTDVWLNTPARPHEASGTSGMKAAVNGVPSLSTLDGWWLEGCVAGVTGWPIGDASTEGASDAADAEDLYRVLRHTVAPLYYEDPDAFTAVGRGAIALNGSFFSAERMVHEYSRRAYRPPAPGRAPEVSDRATAPGR